MGRIKKKKKKKVESPRKRKVKLVFKIIFLIFLLIVLIGGIIFYFKYGRDIFRMQSEAKQLIRESSEETFRQNETSLVYDIEGDLLSTLKGEKDVYYVNYEDIPDHVVEAMISIEDKKFEEHNGVDIKANLRAVKALIDNNGKVTQGASTITQQLSRTVFLTNEVSWQRKVKEIFIATELEKKYAKYQIMEFYLNNIYFGNGYYGIEAASKGYFNKSIGKLSLSQIAFLCAVPNNPTLYDPTENMENTLGRRDRILDQMQKDGKIDSSEYENAASEEIKLNMKKVAKKNYIETYVYDCAIEALMVKQGFEIKYEFESSDKKKEYIEQYNELYTQCQQSLYRNGYRIYTSIDLKKQKMLQASVDDNLEEYKEKNKEGTYEMQSSAVCIDNETGRVAAIVGGRSQDMEGYTLNRAFQSFRQPGSAIKPLIVYTPAFEKGDTPDTIAEDKKEKDGPENSNGRYQGKVTLRKAVEQSINTVAYSMLQEMTPKVGLSYLLNMNFSKIDKKDYQPTAALGGFTNGVSAVEMASAYAALQFDGIYRNPTCIVHIMDAKGGEVVADDIKNVRVYEQNAARTMTDVLVGVLKNGTGRGLTLDSMVAAGKTGTTNDNKDGWFVGYTPYYTTSVWVGYDIPKEIKNLKGSTYPGEIWQQFMNEIHEDLEPKEFLSYYNENQEKVKATKKPKKTEEATEEPEETIEPEVTQEEISEEEMPDDSDSGDTVDPENFETPVPEDTPQETAQPEVTQAPVVQTDTPVAEPTQVIVAP